MRIKFDGFTLTVYVASMLFAVFGALRYSGFLTPVLQEYLAIFGAQRQPGLLQPFGALAGASLLGIVAWLIIMFSAAIEKDNAGNEFVLTMAFLAALFMVLGILGLGGVHWAYAVLVGDNGRLSLEGGIWAAVAGIVGLISFLPALLLSALVYPVALGMGIAALICLPRLIYYHTVRHPLRQAWERGETSGRMSPQDISNALGDPSKNTTHARKLQAELERLEKDIQRKRAELEKDRDALRSAILGDAERFETEKRISRIVTEFEELKAEVSVYDQYLNQGGKR